MLFLPAQKAAVLAGWVVAFAYALLAGFEIPTQRTLYMLSVVALALWSQGNRTNLIEDRGSERDSHLRWQQ